MVTKKLRSLGLAFGTMVLAVSALAGGAIMLNSSDNNSKSALAAYSPSTTYTNGDASTYYNGISSSATGTTLLSALQSLNSSKRSKTIGYNAMGTSSSSSPYCYTDYDPSSTISYDSKNQPYSTTFNSFYTKTAMTSYNKEHVWPDSRGGSAVEADIHMPRPTITAENSNRGNSFYVEGVATSANGWDPYTAGYSESVRGEAARIIFYCMVASSSLSLSDATTLANSATGYSSTMGKLSDMLKWNLNYSVSTYETNRNEGAEYLQGNRNPFIDHPEYACKIWGDTNSTTQSICSASSTAPTSVTVTPSSASIAVGGTTTLTSSVNSGAASTVTWSTTNSSVATVSGGVVTGVGAGTCTIKATSTVDTSVYGSASITVKALSTLTYTGTPSTTSYESGNSFDPTGLTITAKYSDNSTVTLNGSDLTWSPSPLTAGTTSVTGTYGGKTITVSGLTVTQASGGTAMYTVASASSVTTDTSTYTYPSGSSATFENTYSTANQITKSNTQTLTLSNYSGMVINNITLNMKSNGSSGAGGLKYSLDGGTTYTDIVSSGTAFSDTNWNGSYTTTFTDISKTVNISVSSSIKIVLSASVNSLYCQSYSIGWTGGSASVAVTGVSLSSSSLSIYAGDTSTLTATITPSDATNKNVSWSSSNTSAATVSGGVVTGVAAGSTTITVTTSDGSKTATCSVTVTANALSSLSSSGTLSKTAYYTGQSFDSTGLTITATFASGSTSDVTSNVTWSPSPLTTGTTSVTGSYTNNGVTKTVTISGITVTAPTLSSISTSGETTSYALNDSFSYDGICTATMTDGSTSTVTPTVDSSSINMAVANTYTIGLSYTLSGVTKTTSYSITVSDSSNLVGTYTLTSNTTTYTTPTTGSEADALLNGLNNTSGTQALTVSATSNTRFGGSPLTSAIMMGGSSAGSTISIDTTNSGYIVSKVVVSAQSYTSSTISTLTCSGISQTVSNYYNNSTSNYADFTFYPLNTTFTLDTLSGNSGAGYRSFVASITVTVIRISDGDDAYGDLFNVTTATECAALAGISDANWTFLSTVYTKAHATVKSDIVGAVANASGTSIQEAMYRYDMIVAKYSATNFLGRASSSNVTSSLNDNSNLAIILLIIGLGFSATAILYFLKKKKHSK